MGCGCPQAPWGPGPFAAPERSRLFRREAALLWRVQCFRYTVSQRGGRPCLVRVQRAAGRGGGPGPLWAARILSILRKVHVYCDAAVGLKSVEWSLEVEGVIRCSLRSIGCELAGRV